MNVFYPADVERLTGVSVQSQREWRRRGLTKKVTRGGWERLGSRDVLRIYCLSLGFRGELLDRVLDAVDAASSGESHPLYVVSDESGARGADSVLEIVTRPHSPALRVVDVAQLVQKMESWR